MLKMTVTKKSLETEPIHWLDESGATLCGLVNQRRSTHQERLERIVCWDCACERQDLDEGEMHAELLEGEPPADWPED